MVDIDHVGPTETGRGGQGLCGSGGVSGDDTISIIESVSLDAVTSLSYNIVDGEGGATTTFSVDQVKTAITDTGNGVDVQDLIESAGGSADCQLSIVVIGGCAIGTDSLNQVESIETDANSID